MKKFTKIMSLILALVMMLSLAACGGNGDNTDETKPAEGTVSYVDPYADLADDYDALSEALYYDVLGEYYEEYMKVADASSVSERYALQAIAEAKLMESAVMLPIYSAGGNFAMNKVAPYTWASVGWGYSEYRYNTALVCNEPIVGEHYTEMKLEWAARQASGDFGGYYEWAKQYLADKGYTLKDTYTIDNTRQPKTWDGMASSRSVEGQSYAPTWESLIVYDCENQVSPGMAENWEKTVNDDGTVTYTFNLRQGAMWVDSQGRELAEVTAHDYVTGLQHMMDAKGGLEYLISGVIVNAEEYIGGFITDMAEVGVKAVDDYTLQYTLAYDCPYFISMLNYSLFAPMNRAFYESKGGKFGAEYDASAADYTYGVTPEDIAYCGPYRVTNYTPQSTTTYVANESYWDYENTTVKTYTVLFYDNTDTTKVVNDFLAGTVDGSGLNSASVEVAKSKALPDGYVSAKGATNYYDEYNYVVDTDTTSYMGFLNINRIAMNNVASDGGVPSSKTEEDVLRSNAALRNVHFRRALCMSVDRAAYNAQSVGEELKLASLRNTYVPGNFVTLTEDVTVSINGNDTTFPAGTKYGEVMQAQIDADGLDIMVWNPEANDGLGSGDGYDGWFNPENAVAELTTAIEELAAIGIEVSAENPIYIDYPVYVSSANYNNKGQSLKQSVESVLGGAVIVNITECVTSDDWYYTGYYTSYGYEANYELYDLSGWGPDFEDPQTYLDTFLPDYAGYMIKCIGIY